MENCRWESLLLVPSDGETYWLVPELDSSYSLSLLIVKKSTKPYVDSLSMELILAIILVYCPDL